MDRAEETYGLLELVGKRQLFADFSRWQLVERSWAGSGSFMDSQTRL